MWKDDSLYLMHHGIKGQKWGVRRFETTSGHLTSAGKKRYAKYDHGSPKKSKSLKSGGSSSSRSAKLKKAAKVAAGVAAVAGTAALATYGAKQLGENIAYNKAYNSASDATRAILDANKTAKISSIANKNNKSTKFADNVNKLSDNMIKGTSKVIGGTAKGVSKGFKTITKKTTKTDKSSKNKIVELASGTTEKLKTKAKEAAKNKAKEYFLKDVDPNDIRTWSSVVKRAGKVAANSGKVLAAAKMIKAMGGIAMFVKVFRKL